MCEIGGRPIVSYIIETLNKCGFDAANFLVAGFQQEKVREYFGDKVNYVVQEELKARLMPPIPHAKLPSNVNQVLVINGDDSALFSASHIRFCERTFARQAAVSVLFQLSHSIRVCMDVL